MADVLVSSVVSSIVRNLNTSALQEFGLAWGLRTELDKLESTLSTIQAVLHDAEVKQWKSEAIKNWLIKLKDAAYDADNVLDEFQTEALRRKVEMERGVTKQVSSLFFNKIRFLFRIKIGHKLKNVRERLDAIAGERSKFHLTVGVTNMEVDHIESRQTSSLVNEPEIYGRDEEKEKIFEVLLANVSDQDDVAIYAIWGTGGLGKTTLAQFVYNDARVVRHFEMRIWVCVSDDFQIRRLVKAILESIDGSGCSITELDPLQRCLQKKLHGRRFLLVLDDVWNEDHAKWDGLKKALACGSNGSMVLVTTRNEKIALMMTKLPKYIHQISYLSENDSWSLFKGRAFGVGREAETSDLEIIGKEIVKKCGGVPLAIKALGSMMRLKQRSEWLSMKESEIWDLSETECAILPALRLSYHHLPPHMRQCFAYCCIFPKDWPLLKNKLIQLWMANGFIPFIGQKELHDIDLDIFNELVWRSFFQDVKEHDDISDFSYCRTTCKMHDLMHDLAQSIMMSECYLVESDKVLKIPKGIRHLSIFLNLSQTTPWNENILKVPSLRSCIIDNYDNQCSAILPCFSKQKYLRAWECRRYRQDKKLPVSLGNLKFLRYLDLSSSDIEVLPKSTTCLSNLQTLKLNYCHKLHKLPKVMKHMKNLWHLGITSCESLTRMPKEMGRLTCLQSLSLFIVGKKDGYQISELKALNLREDLCIDKLDNVRNLMDAKNANLISKQNLQSLSLSWWGDNNSNVPEHVEDVLEGLQPHSSLKKLYIFGYQGSKFPTWMKYSLLQNLEEIVLAYCGRCEHLPPLGKLPFLNVLKIHGMDAVKYIGSEFYGDGIMSFPSLKTFELRDIHNLEEWTMVNQNGTENFPCLSSLYVSNCRKLVELPIIPSVTSLTTRGITTYTLQIRDCRSPLSFPVNGLLGLSSLRRLQIQNCAEFSSLSEGVQYLTALEELLINRCPRLNSLPQGIQHLTALRSMRIWDCQGLFSLPKQIGCLTSLSSLEIEFCFNLMSLPEELQNLTSLKELRIKEWPHLEKRYRKDNGEDWHKIAHIPSIDITDQQI